MYKDIPGEASDDHGAADELRDDNARMWVKFTLRDKLSEGVSHETDFMLLAVLIVAVILSCFVCICVAILLAQNMRKWAAWAYSGEHINVQSTSSDKDNNKYNARTNGFNWATAKLFELIEKTLYKYAK